MDGIEVERVSDWLTQHIEGVQAPFDFRLVAGGRSNLTFEVTDAAGRAMVLRRPPLGQVLQSAHDVAREHRLISACAPTPTSTAPPST
jgi:aminoglycoside phosphotransferase (APT) family kinase protein